MKWRRYQIKRKLLILLFTLNTKKLFPSTGKSLAVHVGCLEAHGRSWILAHRTHPGRELLPKRHGQRTVAESLCVLLAYSTKLRYHVGPCKTSWEKRARQCLHESQRFQTRCGTHKFALPVLKWRDDSSSRRLSRLSGSCGFQDVVTLEQSRYADILDN